MDPRNALRLPEDDGNASTISAKLSIIPLLSFPCLTRESKKYKALAHDMQAESNALQQRFLPQPVLRSSWQQLVIFGLEPDISFRFPCLLPLSHPRASIARPGDLLDCRIKSGNDGIIFSSVILERFPVMFGLEPDISFTDSRVKHGNDRGEEKRPAMTKRKISMNMTEEKK